MKNIQDFGLNEHDFEDIAGYYQKRIESLEREISCFAGMVDSSNYMRIKELIKEKETEMENFRRVQDACQKISAYLHGEEQEQEERMTRRDLSPNGKAQCNITKYEQCNWSCSRGMCDWCEGALMKLKEYEDDEEKGLLLRLPF